MCVLNVENFMLFFRLSLIPNTAISYYESIMVRIYSVREIWLFVCLLEFNATLSNTSVIPWRLVLFVEETGYTRKNYRPAVCHWQTLLLYVVSNLPRHERDSKAQRWWCLCTDCTFNYHPITTKMAPARIYMHHDYVRIKYATLGIITHQ